MNADSARYRRELADTIAATGALTDPALREAVESVPRELFLGNAVYRPNGTAWEPVRREEIGEDEWLRLACTDQTWVTRAFDPSLLAYFRRRLARSRQPDRIFDAVREVVAATGVIKGKHRRALDSAVLEGAVATQDTVTQLIAAISRVIRDVPGADTVTAEYCRAHDYTDPGKPRIAWNDEEARAPSSWTRSSPMPCSYWAAFPSRTSAPGRPMPWGSWPWWPGRTWNPLTTPTAPTDGGVSPAAPPTAGWSPPSTPMPGTSTRPSPAIRTASRLTSPSSPRPA